MKRNQKDPKWCKHIKWITDEVSENSSWMHSDGSEMWVDDEELFCCMCGAERPGLQLIPTSFDDPAIGND